MSRKRIVFQESGRKSVPAPRSNGQNVSRTPAAKDHVGWALWWSEQCRAAMDRYIKDGNPLDLEHVHRCGRFLWWHICRAKKYYYWDSQKREGSI